MSSPLSFTITISPDEFAALLKRSDVGRFVPAVQAFSPSQLLDASAAHVETLGEEALFALLGVAPDVKTTIVTKLAVAASKQLESDLAANERTDPFPYLAFLKAKTAAQEVLSGGGGGGGGGAVKLAATPLKTGIVLENMPAGLSELVQGEWALKKWHEASDNVKRSQKVDGCRSPPFLGEDADTPERKAASGRWAVQWWDKIRRRRDQKNASAERSRLKAVPKSGGGRRTAAPESEEEDEDEEEEEEAAPAAPPPPPPPKLAAAAPLPKPAAASPPPKPAAAAPPPPPPKTAAERVAELKAKKAAEAAAKLAAQKSDDDDVQMDKIKIEGKLYWHDWPGSHGLWEFTEGVPLEKSMWIGYFQPGDDEEPIRYTEKFGDE
jgi:hypothetical protein